MTRATNRRRRDQQAEKRHTRKVETQAPSPHGRQAHKCCPAFRSWEANGNVVEEHDRDCPVAQADWRAKRDPRNGRVS